MNFRTLLRSCPQQSQLLSELSKPELMHRKASTEKMLAIVGLLALSVIGMAIWSGLYPLILTSIAMQPAFSDYFSRRRKIMALLRQGQ
jgi:hypothetical protein